jgi:excisionase family DNA binding protein
MITNSTTLQKESVPPLVKVRDVANLLSISRSTVRNLIDSGDLAGSRINPCEKRRNHLRVTRASLLKFYKKRFGHSLTRALANPFEP